MPRASALLVVSRANGCLKQRVTVSRSSNNANGISRGDGRAAKFGVENIRARLSDVAAPQPIGAAASPAVRSSLPAWQAIASTAAASSPVGRRCKNMP